MTYFLRARYPLFMNFPLFHSFTQVSTRTTGLSPVQHANFNLRFSALSDVEAACREEEERRAGRTIDWIGSRIGQQAASWLEDPASRDQEKWWDDIKSCVQGDRTPVRSEGWNHPMALILATSTLAPNPLQAITILHARAPDLPPWVDTSMYRYTVIVHPSPSNLNPDEAVALLNAVKKQFGLNTHLLQLPSLRENTTISIPPYFPQLPPSESSHPYTPSRPGRTVTLAMSEMDAQNTSRFVREFVTMSLLPWMERCVTEWNESFSSSRRLPRLFSSTTRRFFGSPSPSPAPMATSSAASTTASGTNGHPSWQYRRLAEFATILGDYKLATAVWDSLRKESNSGTDVLPLLLAPSTSLASYAATSLAPLGLSEPGVPASAQLRAMVYAVRWELGIQNFAEIQGERWLAWAAGLAEEPSSALLLARAASISFHRGARRRAALWFAVAARRLERSGIKALTIYLLERPMKLCPFQKIIRSPLHSTTLKGPSCTLVLMGSSRSFITRW
ncbi:hypothetical protein BS47DRAFT_419756 [Hydnum rufescens UP504]|uniref:Uncharacterized protein n=1 Tax=Hydnum rufescens UP504 TaxID=1448309 RepID=A0A9P6B5S7_9AGAM|nr:hypothetical protein BS47DRAFT_419756 [Hydnum rufescens UP504]